MLARRGSVVIQPLPRMPRHIRELLRTSGGKFESSSAKRAWNIKENGRRTPTCAYVLLFRGQNNTRSHLLAYWFCRRRTNKWIYTKIFFRASISIIEYALKGGYNHCTTETMPQRSRWSYLKLWPSSIVDKSVSVNWGSGKRCWYDRARWGADTNVKPVKRAHNVSGAEPRQTL